MVETETSASRDRNFDNFCRDETTTLETRTMAEFFNEHILGQFAVKSGYSRRINFSVTILTMVSLVR